MLNCFLHSSQKGESEILKYLSNLHYTSHNDDNDQVPKTSQLSSILSCKIVFVLNLDEV